jgi:hypothetical protein
VSANTFLQYREAKVKRLLVFFKKIIRFSYYSQPIAAREYYIVLRVACLPADKHGHFLWILGQAQNDGAGPLEHYFFTSANTEIQ